MEDGVGDGVEDGLADGVADGLADGTLVVGDDDGVNGGPSTTLLWPHPAVTAAVSAMTATPTVVRLSCLKAVPPLR